MTINYGLIDLLIGLTWFYAPVENISVISRSHLSYRWSGRNFEQFSNLGQTLLGLKPDLPHVKWAQIMDWHISNKNYWEKKFCNYKNAYNVDTLVGIIMKRHYKSGYIKSICHCFYMYLTNTCNCNFVVEILYVTR